MNRQLDIYGGESAHPVRVSRRLTPAQREILRMARAAGQIRPIDAGRVIHAHRPGPCTRHIRATAAGCCGYASTDGAAALKRLERHGLVIRVAPRRPWVPHSREGQ